MTNKERRVKTTVWIVSGPSCCGKSTFIEKIPFEKVGFPSADLPVFFPAQLLRGESIGKYQDVILHYNILRPYRIYSEARSKSGNGYHKYIKRLFTFWRKSKGQSYTWEELKPSWDYQKDSLFVYLNKLGVHLKAVVLVANKHLVKQRMQKRKLVEKSWVSDRELSYPRSYWLNVLEHVDLLAVYNSWINFLRFNRIEYQLYNSDTIDYPQLNSFDDIANILYGEKNAV